jgi:hypothetical protein
MAKSKIPLGSTPSYSSRPVYPSSPASPHALSLPAPHRTSGEHRAPPAAAISLPLSPVMASRGGGQTYGFPIYCASWLPLAHILKPSADDAAEADAPSPAPAPPPRPMVTLGGGGGEGNSGVPNALVVAAVDPATAGAPPALSPEPVSDPCPPRSLVSPDPHRSPERFTC